MDDLMDEIEHMIKANHDDRKLARGILVGLKTENKEQLKRKINLIMIIDFLNKRWLPKTFPNAYIKEWFGKNAFIGLLLLTLGFTSCNEILDHPYPCLDGNCDAEFWIETPAAAKQDQNGYWHVPVWGPNYFSIRGKTDELHPEYVINGVPLMETSFDSDYWVLFDTIQYRFPVYSHLGLYRDRRFKDPIPIGNRTYTMVDIANNHPPLNIVGYQISKHFCYTCPYAIDLLAVYSKYNYEPKCNIFFDKSMVGDTATITIEILFNSDYGESIKRQYRMNIVFDPK